VAVSRFFEGAARVSPDGKWVAYTSNESGDFQVYVRPFPGLDARYAVSTSRRAMAPAWSRDGGTLYYVAGGGGTNELVAATIRTASDFSVVSRAVVYRGALRGGPFGTSYDASPDGTHLVIAQPVATDEIMVIHGWAAELRARLANKLD
jgi:Tol biopolymer transport system component